MIENIHCWIIIKYYVNWSNQAADVIQRLSIAFMYPFSISGIVKAGTNTFHKYGYECKICVLYKTQTGFCE